MDLYLTREQLSRIRAMLAVDGLVLRLADWIGQAGWRGFVQGVQQLQLLIGEFVIVSDLLQRCLRGS